jgi:type I restriction enzyme R subunit
MAKKKKAPELTFQQHIADYLVREHRYGVLDSPTLRTRALHRGSQLWVFLKATQADTLKKLADDYGTDAREEVFKALRKELEHTPLWMLFRQGLPVRGLEFRLFYPKPRSAASAAAANTPRTASPSARTSTSATPTRRLISSSTSTACPSWRWS